MAEKIVVFGAGATGRGHVGLLAWQAGFEIVFVDKKLPLVDALRRQGRYTVRIFGEQTQEIVVSGYRVYHSLDRAAVAEEIRDARLVLTAVFDQNLADVAETLALGIAACARAGRTAALNCIACENMMDSSTQLGPARPHAPWRRGACLVRGERRLSRLHDQPRRPPPRARSAADRHRRLQRMDRAARIVPRREAGGACGPGIGR